MFRFLGIAATLCLATALPAETLSVLPGSTATFKVHARRLFGHEVVTGVDTSVSGTVTVSDATPVSVTAELTLDAAAFKTGSGLRDRDVRGALRAKAHPAITFTLTALPGYDSGAAAPQTLTAQGTLSVGGSSVDLSLPVTLTPKDGRTLVHADGQTGFKALGIRPPGLPVLVHVDDPIELSVDLIVGRP